MAGMGGLMGQHVTQGLFIPDGSRGQVDSRSEQPEKTRRREALIYQINRISAIFYTVLYSNFIQI